MKFLPPVLLSLHSKRELDQVFMEIGAHQDSLSILERKGRYYIFRLYDLRPQAALILKQEALARGAELAISWDTISTREGPTDALLMATESQLFSLCEKLRAQPFELFPLAEKMERVVRNLNGTPPPSSFRGQAFNWGKRTFIMGVINLTPDSFSGDGLFSSIDRALQRAEEMIANGADIIDVGAESTRPGHTPVSAEEEWKRLEPFLKEFLSEATVPVSLDTYKAEVAARGLELGVDMINDIWGLKRSPEIAHLVKESGAGLILMHNKEEPNYQHFLPEVIQGLEKSVEMALEAGVPQEKIIVDPGFGFGKTAEHGYQMLKNLRAFRSLGFPLLIGISRKSFIGKITGKPPQERIMGTAAYCALAIEGGCDILRVHDVPEIKEVALVCDRIFRSQDIV
ncbi:MAG: dihydropteroate synthase [Caldiserica bacterium]|jgi:dihydropteroate synthase|nr:dihydropteroate synthase [Caldisericota bacterium]